MKPDFSWTASSRSRTSAGMSDRAGTGKRLMGAWEVVMGRVSDWGVAKAGGMGRHTVGPPRHEFRALDAVAKLFFSSGPHLLRGGLRSRHRATHLGRRLVLPQSLVNHLTK